MTVKNTEPTKADIRLKKGRIAGVFGICTNLILFAAKIAVGLIAGSVAIVADAVNNLSDAGSSAFVLFGYILSGKPADKEHPFGHARMEYLCGLFISVIVTVLGVELFKESVSKLISGDSSAQFTLLSVIIMAATMLCKGAMALYYSSVAKKIDSHALHASAVDSISDIIATGAVVAGMLLTRITGPRTDAVLGCAIAVYIIALGIKLIKDASETLIGTAPDTEFVAELVRDIRSYEGVIGIHDLVVHSYGADRYFVSVHIEVDAECDVMKSHDLIDNIEDDFRRERGIYLVVHMDPVQHSDPKVNEMRGKVSEIISQISSEYGSPASMHDFRVVLGVTHSNLIFDIAITDSFPVPDSELCDTIQDEIKKLDSTYNAVITVDRDYTSNRYGEKMG